MAIRTREEYIKSLLPYNKKVFTNGDRVTDPLDHPVTRSVVEATAKMFDMANDPEFKDIMVAYSPYINENVNRNVQISRSREDLEMRYKMARLTSQYLGTCNYRCVGQDTTTAMASVTWEMDRDLGTDYNTRLTRFIEKMQREDLACSGAVTDPKGDRGLSVAKSAPEDYLRVVEKKSDGIIVRGAKVHQSGAIAANCTMVIPNQTLQSKDEADIALSFAFSGDTEGITYITQYTPFSAERMEAKDDVYKLGNPLYGQRETCIIVFDNVFIPWENVFMCGEWEYAGKAVERFGKTHRMNCGGACKVGYQDIIIGATMVLAEYLGVNNKNHVKDKFIDMVAMQQTSWCCAIAAAAYGFEEPLGSGIWMPDDMFGNVAKYNTAHNFWQTMKLAGDIAGGLAVTMPSEKELDNPETAEYIRKYYRAHASAEKRMRMTKVLQNWVAGLHGVGTWQGAGSIEAQRLMIRRLMDSEEYKKLAKIMAGITD
jgi:4-hydroxybutyryl-CoA dehydratase/vinylacetyl-CoA-Delta-isomerase